MSAVSIRSSSMSKMHLLSTSRAKLHTADSRFSNSQGNRSVSNSRGKFFNRPAAPSEMGISISTTLSNFGFFRRIKYKKKRKLPPLDLLALLQNKWRLQIHLIFDVNIVFIFRAPSVLLPSQKARHHSHMCLIRTTVLEICHFITGGLQLHSMK